MVAEYVLSAVGVIVAGILLAGIRIIRPTHMAAVETLGKYQGIRRSGITYIVPIIQRLYAVNITEQLVDISKQDVITKDNLNCTVDAQIYYRVGGAPRKEVADDASSERATEDDIKRALYHVNDYKRQVVQLAHTTLRNVIGEQPFSTVNSDRVSINASIFNAIQNEVTDWGIGIVRVEMKEVKPPEEVQITMNAVIQAENEKQAAVDLATAVETKADGDRRAAIKIAQGEATAITTVAEARAKEIQLVNEAADRYFKGNAQVLKKMEVTRDSLVDNSKVVLSESGISPILVLGNGDKPVVIPDERAGKTKPAVGGGESP